MTRMSPQARRTARDLALTVPIGLVITVASVYLMQVNPMPGRALIGLAAVLAMAALGMLPSYVRQRLAMGCPIPERHRRPLAVAAILTPTVGPVAAVAFFLTQDSSPWGQGLAMLAVNVLAIGVAVPLTLYLRRRFPRASEGRREGV